MFEVGQYVVYKRDVCKIKAMKKQQFNNEDYYVLEPIGDPTLIIDIPVANRNNFLRPLITKDQVAQIIKEIPNIAVVDHNDKMIETEYKNLINSNTHADLIKIIKTTYLRNKSRLDSGKKVGDRDNQYLDKAEKFLYNELAIVLDMSVEDTKKYIIEEVDKLIKADN